MARAPNRILLIEPPFYRLFKETYSLDRYPLSLGYLAGTVKRETSWEVMAYNADFTAISEFIQVSHLTGEGFKNYLGNLKDLTRTVWREIESVIEGFTPDVVGITAKSQNFASALNIARLVKEYNDEITVIVGGPHVSMVGKEALKNPHVDIGVTGEGERTIVELLTVIGERRDFDAVKGIVYKKNGDLIENEKREFIEDLDSLCFPHVYARDVLKDFEKYSMESFKNVFATRGCPYDCFFCGSRKIWSRKVRYRSPDNVVKEIKSLQAMGVRSVHFDDDNFGIKKEYINNLCEAIMRECPDLKWSCEIHVKLVSEQTISIMKKAGCRSIQIGIESGDNRILKEIRKNITIEEAYSACKIIKRAGISLEVFFMVGFPQETEETLAATVKAIKKVKSNSVTYSIFTPYPNTDAYDYCKEKGLVDDGFDVSLYNHKSPENSFCAAISPERFRVLASRIEKMVDKKNSQSRSGLNRFKRVFTREALDKIREAGIQNSIRHGMRILTGK
jgi:radical SAM superfamily enzyme YgiQ (UPF0313 family)